MSQSRRGSLVESIVNVAVGYGVAVATQMVVLPMFGMVGRTQDHLAIAGIFSVVSVARSYCVRRAFNYVADQGERMMTPEEADKAYDEAPAIPISDEEIERIVAAVVQDNTEEHPKR